MKKFLIVGTIVLILLGAGMVTYIVLHTSSTPQKPGGTTFPAGGTNGVPGTGTPSVEVLTQAGKIETKDFIHNGITVEDPANKGNYYLAGSSGVCKPDGTCPKAGTTTAFEALYWSSTGAFTISLEAEPLGQTRKDAEQYLMDKLGIGQQQMCELNYYIGTTAGVNEAFSGENLGFSFCPNAVKLP